MGKKSAVRAQGGSRKTKTSEPKTRRLASNSANREGTTHYNIRDARSLISRLVDSADRQPSIITTIGRRQDPSALLLSYERFEPLLRGDLNAGYAFVIVDYLFKDAPLHIRKPQITELAQLPRPDLLLILSIEKLPLQKSREKELEEKLENPQVLKRLLRRYQIAQAIAKAREEGLYEAEEHLTSKVGAPAE